MDGRGPEGLAGRVSLAAGARRVPRRTAAALASAFVLVRLVTLAADPRSLWHAEELYTGAVAREVLAGPAFGILDLQGNDYAGGTLVVGLTATLPFALLGPRFVALKLTALGWSLATFLVWLPLLACGLGRRPAVLAGVVWAAAPPLVVQLSLMAWANHGESALLTGLALTALVAALEGRPAGRGRLFAAGLAAGFAVWFCYLSLVVLAAAALAVAASLGPARSLRLLPIAALGLTLGLVPWVAYASVHGLGGLAVHGTTAGEHLAVLSAPALAAKAGALARDLARLLAGDPALGTARWALALLLGGGAIAGAVRSVRSAEGDAVARALRLTIAFAPALLLLGWLLSAWGSYPPQAGPFAFRFFAAVVPALAGLAGAGLDLLPGRLAPALVAALAVGPLALPRSRPARWLDWRGDSYVRLGLRIGERGGLERRLAELAAIRDASDRAHALSAGAGAAVRTDVARLVAAGRTPDAALDEVCAPVEGRPEPLALAVGRACANESAALAARGAADQRGADGWRSRLAAAPPDAREGLVRAAILHLAAGSGQAAEAFAGTLDGREREAAFAALGELSVRRKEASAPPGAPADREAWFRGAGAAAVAAGGSEPAGPAVSTADRCAWRLGARERLAAVHAFDPAFAADEVDRFDDAASPLACPGAGRPLLRPRP